MNREELTQLIEQVIDQVHNLCVPADMPTPPKLELLLAALRDFAPTLAEMAEAKHQKASDVKGLFVRVPGKWLKEEAYWLPELRQFVDETKTYVIDYSDLHAWLQTCRNTRQSMEAQRMQRFGAT